VDPDITLVASASGIIHGLSARCPVPVPSTHRAASGGPQRAMLAEYLPIGLFLIISTVMGLVLLTLGGLLGPKRPGSEKAAPYECGFEAFEDARSKFDVRFYLIAILFIIFDLEIAFLFPWAVVLDDIGMPGILAMAMFLFILLLGFAYDWKKGALEWD
jgi:NADH-quinone oxidoreductase subunit A